MSTKAKSKRESMRHARFAEGGSKKMFPEQAANPQKPGGTAYAVKGGAPGAKAAKAAKGGKSAPVGGLFTAGTRWPDRHISRRESE